MRNLNGTTYALHDDTTYSLSYKEGLHNVSAPVLALDVATGMNNTKFAYYIKTLKKHLS